MEQHEQLYLQSCSAVSNAVALGCAILKEISPDLHGGQASAEVEELLAIELNNELQKKG